MRKCFVDVVRHEDDRRAERFVNVHDLILQCMPDDRVDGAERFVHQQQRRFCGECACHADPLLFATGKFAWIPRTVAPGIELDEFEQLIDAGGDPCAVPTQEHRHRRDVLRDRHVRKQAGGLNRVADASPQRDRIAAGDISTADDDRAGRDGYEPVHRAQ